MKNTYLRNIFCSAKSFKKFRNRKEKNWSICSVTLFYAIIKYRVFPYETLDPSPSSQYM